MPARRRGAAVGGWVALGLAWLFALRPGPAPEIPAGVHGLPPWAEVGSATGARAGAGEPAPVPPPPRLTAAAAILMDWETGQVLYEKNATQKRPPASTTKVLTAILALERARLDDVVTISSRAARVPGSSMYVRAGETYTLQELLYGLLLHSGNDAAVAIAEHVAGSVEAFAQLMNEKARAIGARSSHFLNPHGLHQPGHYSTAYDLALITRYALENPVFAEIVRQRHAEILVGEETRALRNTNRLLWMYEGADGVKTGTTSAAGACLIASATQSDPDSFLPQKLVTVVLDADGRWRDSIRLLEWGFTNFRLARVARAGEVIGYLPVAGGLDPWVPIVPRRDLAAAVPRAERGRLSVRVDLPPRIRAPVAAGQVLGRATVLPPGPSAGRPVDLVAGQPVGRATWATYLARALLPWLRWSAAR
ncbi:D-alanyl-D-alanine carboxypeptidase family protein [Caldinitratiruptor microaerophilus]|uniref:serine-type D-Ala-D-Ala carboxypeptidase n=1 Tax=Caldinitratiruptor microaerophilus TaxID=671077 RepID=A0AA35G5H9_9FIRM|nr:D-alanyl-D-alanine carboxypeptidase family protein [Caldinitratiruptor microaerophilus]BDG59446.1 serine-type D-Ala-D-Ala carboxypeptidase [Caldinitratiruptor microaerophilus]